MKTAKITAKITVTYNNGTAIEPSIPAYTVPHYIQNLKQAETNRIVSILIEMVGNE